MDLPRHEMKSAGMAPPAETDWIVRRGLRCCIHVWRPTSSPIGLAVIFHGYAAHARYPTVGFVADLLCSAGFACCAMDLPGHGQSDGQRGLIESAEFMVEDCVAATQAAMIKFPGLPAVLVGSSMGGTLAVRV